MNKNSKKALIVTINNTNYNYGNRLQNYAIVAISKKMRIECDTLCFERESNLLNKIKIKRFLHRATMFKLTSEASYWRTLVQKDINFLDFDEKYIRMLYSSKKADFADKYDYYFTGSDQVWNPSWYNNGELRKNYYLLTFAKSKKKISVCPSFGVNSIQDDWKVWFSNCLKDFKGLSVREEAGAEIIKELTSRDPEILVDPTMMLDSNEWIKLEKKPKNIDEKAPYILTYFLGGRSREVENHISLYSKDNNLLVYNLLDPLNKNVFVSGPSEFIFLIHHASLILTDSFHACVFSILFNKPFVVYDRVGAEKGMISRLQTLLKKFGLVRKYINSGENNELFEHDYKDAYDILTFERAKFDSYLKSVTDKGN